MPFADLTGGRLFYEWGGPDHGTVMVLSHSIGADRSMWNWVLPEFCKAYRTLSYDTRGHGESSIFEEPASLDRLGSDVVELLDLLGIERCIFCGLSLGGMIGIWLGINAPHRLSRLVLANTASRIGTEDGWNDRIRSVRERGMESIADTVLERWFTAEFRRRSADTVAGMRLMQAATPREGYASCAAAIRDADLTGGLDRIGMPTLVVTGTFDPATTADEGRRLARQIRGAEYVELKTSHLSAIEDPMGFASAVVSFMQRGEE